MSIFSFPNRGPWGSSAWRGNCSGHVYKEIFGFTKPQVFVDPMVGSGTSVEVANEMGIEAYGLDLHQGFNILRNSIAERVGKQADLVLSHPPYGSMVLYSGEVWGTEPHPDDLSRCIDDNDFHRKLQTALLNQREATKAGGLYGTIIGDLRSKGRYVSYQAECIARLPADELQAVLIKAQHNTMSGSRSYATLTMPRITHEYILLWKKKESTIFGLLASVAQQAQSRLTGTWKSVVQQCLMQVGGKATLSSLYEVVSQNAPRAQVNAHWKEKVRQILNQNPDLFRSDERGVWALA